MIKKQFAVIGLGRFGSSVCKELYKLGHQVLAIDSKEEKVNDMTRYSTHSAIANGTDEKALQSLGIRNFDYVIVAIGDDIQSSILCTLLLKEFGVTNVWVKAQNYYHERVLEKIGADRIVHPEQDMGIRIAQHLTSEKIVDYIELSADYSIVELIATDKVANKSLIDLDVRAKYGCTILGIKRGEDINIAPTPTDQIEKSDILIVIGHKNDLKRFEDEGM
ncbi:TrkA family potassium uptake protein [Alkalihalobacillus sp. MEB130]|uniref:potassium channel family protein n=1 Tax=Alkalihalobacillus sp. MEB130 TaxID=2976704 RepID=UPI0028DD99F8|nr:TrkA family potassium uptake protein [Alkalihalobacillus sp. MEB130]MDT8859573.1 TrkA family potassium uptake protein [Alkalihalobacillus sp. MEB130]